MSHLFTVDEMFYLYNGGRITRSTYLVARFAQIKPIMHVTDDGKLTAIGKVIGRKKALRTMIDKVVETIDEPEKQVIYISHGDCIKEAEYVKDELNKRIQVKDIFIDYISPVIGIHSGPGTLAIFYFPNTASDRRVPLKSETFFEIKFYSFFVLLIFFLCYNKSASSPAALAELADALDLGSSGRPCRFDSCMPHQNKNCPRGEIGRRKGLKILRRESCRFESDRGHHKRKSVLI